MDKVDEVYQDLLKDILENGTQKGDRTGTGTISVFGRMIRFNMADGFPLLTTKKMYTRGVVTELLWFLDGDTNIKTLVEQNNNIWVGDAYKKYVKELDSDIRGVSVRVVEDKEDKLYEDVPKLAKKIKAKILGIETGSASLQELYRLSISAKGRK